MNTSHEAESTFFVSPDFRTFRLGNEVYYLTPTQGRCFALLLIAWARGMGMSGSYILETARSDSTRISEVYKRGADGPRDEFWDREVFETLKEAKVIVEDHRLDDNHRRPYSSLRHQPPAEIAAA